jgi:hypothetical protein
MLVNQYLKKYDRVWGPYSTKNGRKQLTVRYADSKRYRTISYPKFLVECALERELDLELETIDHIDKNFSNNAWSNLRTVPKTQHLSEDCIRSNTVTIPCFGCGKPITKKAHVLNWLGSTGRKRIFCSRKCSSGHSRDDTTDLGFLQAEEKHFYVDKTASNVETVAVNKGITEEKILKAIIDIQSAYAAQKPKRKNVKCAQCACSFKPDKKKSKFCSSACAHESLKRCSWPSKDALQEMVCTMSLEGVGRKCGVSGNTVKKWCRIYGIKTGRELKNSSTPQ